MKDALAIHRFLLEREIQHQVALLPQPISTADDLPEMLELPARRCVVTRVYAAQGQVLALLVNAGQALTTSAVRLATGARHPRPATHDLVHRSTDYPTDLVAPLLLPAHVRVFVDNQLPCTAAHRGDTDVAVYTATGESGTALGIRPHDLLQLSGATPVNLQTREMERPRVPGAVLGKVPTYRTFIQGT